LKEKIFNNILNWKYDRKRFHLEECLTILSARQVEESFIIEHW